VYELREQGKAPMRVWEPEGFPMEHGVLQQIRNVAQLPITDLVCLMPDGHFGIGGPVGGVMVTRRAIVPALVGVDIGCGMVAAKLSLPAAALEGKLPALRSAIEETVPHGGPGVKGSWAEPGYGGAPALAEQRWGKLDARWQRILDKHKGLAGVTLNQFGTLGTGNHFIEVCLDTETNVWLMLHSGSRGVGNRIGTYFISKAREQAVTLDVHLPDKDLAWLEDGTRLFEDYVEAMTWAQEYAWQNREIMLALVIAAIGRTLGQPVERLAEAVNCHHNYAERLPEGQFVIRKGAVSARAEQYGIIPGSMGAKSFIVRGKGNPLSYQSCSHGAGRCLSRGQAKRQITVEEHAQATAGVECRKDSGVLDESPRAYKDIDAVMAAQADLVDVVATLKQVLCVKG
jgi:tRNA-splicing ligase RtcB (3'-phosphate/5'-hydroxy nucleic acid ligase)